MSRSLLYTITSASITVLSREPENGTKHLPFIMSYRPLVLSRFVFILPMTSTFAKYELPKRFKDLMNHATKLLMALYLVVNHSSKRFLYTLRYIEEQHVYRTIQLSILQNVKSIVEKKVFQNEDANQNLEKKFFL